MALTDPPDPIQQHLIDMVARGFREADNNWPIFQYVEAELDEWFSSEASDVLRASPRMTFGASIGSYGWFRVTGQHPYEPAPDDQVTLSVAGMARSTELRASADQFVQLINYLASRLRAFTPDPVTVVPLVVTSEEILEHFDSLTYPRKCTTLADVSFLADVLEHEPPVWRCPISKSGDELAITLIPTIRRYANLRDVDDYLQRFEEQFSPASQTVEPTYPPELALPEAIDYLNARWQVQPGHTGPLIPVARVEAAARLGRECANAEELDSALSAFSAIVGDLNLPTGKTTLFGLGKYLERTLPDESRSRALEAVEDLRAVIDLRAWRQHGNSERLERGMRRLNVKLPTNNWTGSWVTIQWRSIHALNAIREEIEHGDFASRPSGPSGSI
ncbi:MAG: hypothetical protein WA359_12430 [Acidimicrobiales bacterium]